MSLRSLKRGGGLAFLGLTSFAMAGEEYIAPKEVLPPPPAPSCPWTLEAALLYLEADSETGSGYEDQDYETGYRFTLAYRPQGNRGYRLRYTDFEGTNGSSSEEGPDVRSIDLEVVNDLSAGSWQGEWFWGLRYFDLEEIYSGSPEVDYTGIGPVIGFDVSKEFGNAWSYYVNGRAAYLFGDDDDDEIEDNNFVLEGGVGVQRDLNIGNCGGYVRLGVESHQWLNMAYEETNGQAFGGVLAFGIRF